MSSLAIIIIDINVRTVNRIKCGIFGINVHCWGKNWNGKQNCAEGASK